MESNLQKFLAYVGNTGNQTKFKDRLRTAVSYRSVSSDDDLRPQVKKMGNWLKDQLDQYGVDTKLVDLSKIVPIPDLPNLVLGKIDGPSGKNLKTVLIYGHYDVQPAKPDDAWVTEDHDPFKLTFLPDGRMVGRGSTDDKGPILGWINILEAHHQEKIDLPVNLRFCFEGMEETGSQGLSEYLATEDAKEYFTGVTDVCISDNYWLTTRTPAVTYGLRGIVYFKVTVEGPLKNLHSGVYGGMVYEPLTILTKLLASLTSSDGTILVPGVNEQVELLTSTELVRYEDINFKSEDIKMLKEKETGNVLVTEEKTPLLMRRMRFPSLSLHGIFGEAESKMTIIPSKVIGEFSIRLVPNQTPDSVKGLVEKYLIEEFDDLHTKCKLTVEVLGSASPWVGNANGPSFKAAKEAIEAVYKISPDFTREGGTIEVALTFSKMFSGKDVLLLPMGRSDDGAHGINEKLDEDNFFKGTEVMGTYLYKLAGGVNN